MRDPDEIYDSYVGDCCVSRRDHRKIHSDILRLGAIEPEQDGGGSQPDAKVSAEKDGVKNDDR